MPGADPLQCLDRQLPLPVGGRFQRGAVELLALAFDGRLEA
jgi:hypothetical protein